jgi:hypothetical protein
VSKAREFHGRRATKSGQEFLGEACRGARKAAEQALASEKSPAHAKRPNEKNEAAAPEKHPAPK